MKFYDPLTIIFNGQLKQNGVRYGGSHPEMELARNARAFEDLPVVADESGGVVFAGDGAG